VSVTDQSATSATRELTLSVAGCTEGEMTVCAKESNGACVVGAQVCTAGRVSADCNGAPSTDTQRCGPGCGKCGVNADACAGGVCQCGAGPACKDGEACCGGVCKSLGDVTSCGSCANNCTAKAGTNAGAVCSNGECSFMCQLPYAICPAKVPAAGEACGVNVSNDIANCGSCGASCKPNLNDATVDYSCKNSACAFTCKPGNYNCDSNQLLNGCETPASVSNCAACGNVCPAQANASPTCLNAATASPFCGSVCNAGFANCNGQEADGCEANTTNDFSNCGACNKSCRKLGNLCINGTCQCGTSGLPCPEYTKCDVGRCVCDPQTDPDKCAQ
jgi:hypothetical protein